MMKFLPFFLILLVTGCSSVNNNYSGEPITGSVVSDSFFADASQFKNNLVKLRLRDTSGDDLFSVFRLQEKVTKGLKLAGYNITQNDDFGILIDVNVRRISRANIYKPNTGTGLLLGGVVGAEAARNTGSGISAVSGMVVGAVAGNTLEAVLKKSGAQQTLILNADVNIGINELNSSDSNEIIIGQSKFKQTQDRSAYKAFSMTDGLEVVVYGGGANTQQVMSAIEDRLARILSGIL